MRTLTILLLLVLVPATDAGVYGLRLAPDNNRVRWLTNIDAEQGVEFEVPGHGLVAVWLGKSLKGEPELFVQAIGAEDGGRDLIVHGLVVNQMRIGLEKRED
jgi:hypothetical protein